MTQPSLPNLRSFIDVLRQRRDVLEIGVEVDPYLEIAEIHRRIIEQEGPALFFTKVKGSPYPIVTNLFGTKSRVDLAFGDHAKIFIETIAKLPHELFPPTTHTLWKHRNLLQTLVHLGSKTVSAAPLCEAAEIPPDLDHLPLLTTWVKDGGPFITLPLVYTEDPLTKVHNLGIYRMQRYSKSTMGLHMQIGKGGGFHLEAARNAQQSLAVNVFIGGPPAAILAALAPLPENVPELVLASLILNKKIKLARHPKSPLPLLAEAEFALVGSVDPNERHPEGPFGDHYGYYSLQHDFPLFRCHALLHRKNAIYPATVVGKPRQEDYYLGNYLQEMLSPLFPLVMPAVEDLWSYAETGYHSLAAAVVRERYQREALVSAFRILGEGQLSLTKFLLLLDKKLNLKTFHSVLEYILERADFQRDLYVFSNTSMDTLDYTGPALNHGSKGVLIGIGQPIRTLPSSFRGEPPSGIEEVKMFCRGCLVISGPLFLQEPNTPAELAAHPFLAGWPLVVLCDSASRSTTCEAAFLWNTFTRFEPAADIHAKSVTLRRFHPALEAPIIIDSRMKPSYPEEVVCDELTSALVTRRWGEYFGNCSTGSLVTAQKVRVKAVE